MVEALANMTTALQLLDGSDAPAEIAAHLDLAVHRLKQAMGIAQAAPTKISKT